MDHFDPSMLKMYQSITYDEELCDISNRKSTSMEDVIENESDNDITVNTQPETIPTVTPNLSCVNPDPFLQQHDFIASY